MQTKVTFNWPNFKFDNDWTLFLDRDGVINHRIPDDYIKKWSEFKFLPGVLDALKIFNDFFPRIVLVTNQAGIEKEILTHDDLREIHRQMLEVIDYFGGRIDDIYYCPYKADLDPLCRKPNPGMALEAQNDYKDIDFHKSIMIGDSNSDIIFGNNLGMRTVLVGSKPNNDFLIKNAIPDCRLDGLMDFARFVKYDY